MKILVVSDSHGSTDTLRDVLIGYSARADMIVHLGDGEKDYNDLIKLNPVETCFVRGNCDFASSAPDTKLIEANGKRIFMTHGHCYCVKHGLSSLKSAARSQNADIALFGHTHTALCEYEDGLYIINPGSLCRHCLRPSFALIDIVSSGIMPNIVYL